MTVLLVVGAGASCSGGAALSDAGPSPGQAASDAAPVVQPGAPGEPSRVVSPEDLGLVATDSYSEADVRFMQGMIPHHAQALEMVALIHDRTDSEALRRMGLRIEISQRDEIRFMKGWIRERGEEVTGYEPMLDAAGRGRPGASERRLMAGMLTVGQMEKLAGARGREFERLFLELMMMHHGGARIMVRDLFASPGGAHASEIFQFASDIDADQMAEIGRMRRMLQELSADGSAPLQLRDN